MTILSPTINIVKKPQKCASPECQNLVTPENIHILLVSVVKDPLAKVYEYCSRSCLEKKLNNVSGVGTPFEVRIVGKPEILSERNPFKMKVLLEITEPKITLFTEQLIKKYGKYNENRY